MALAPNPQNYLLGRGRVYFAQEDPEGGHKGLLDLGNVPEFTVSIGAETLDHYSSRAGLKVRDQRAITEVNVTFGITLDEFSRENLMIAFLGDEAKVTQTSGSATDETVTAKLDRFVPLAHRSVSSVVVKDSTGTTTYEAGTDYVVDATRGWIKALSTGTITQDQPLKVSYDYGALSLNKIAGAKQNEGITGYLVFVGDPALGPAYEFHAWRVSLKPSGDIGLISDDWAQFSLEGECLKDETNHPTDPFFVVYEIA